MKKHCGCSEYDKCEHEIAEVGATPKEAESKDGDQEKVDVEKKDRCWDGYEPVPGKKPYSKGSCAPVKKHEEVIDDLMKSWEGPDSSDVCTCGAEDMEKAEKPFHGYNSDKHAKTGGLNDKYREKYNRENGSNLKRPSKDKNNPRHKSFCARMKGVKGPTSKDGKLTPKGASLQRWACSKSDLGKSWGEIKKEEQQKPTLNAPKKEPSEPMKRLKPGVSETGMPVLSGSAKDIADVLRHHSGMPKNPQPPRKDPLLEHLKDDITSIAAEHAKKLKFSKAEKPEMKSGMSFNKLKQEESAKPDLSRWHDPDTSPSGKKYKDMSLKELDNHILNVWADMSDQFRKEPLKRPDSIKIDGPKSADGEKGEMKKAESKKLAVAPKPPMGHAPNGKKYEDMSLDELSSHAEGLFSEKPKAPKASKPKVPGPLVASEAGKEEGWKDQDSGKEYKPSWSKESNWKEKDSGKEYKPSWSKKKDLDKGDVVDLKSKAKPAAAKPAAPAAGKKPDTRSRDEKIKDALASQGEKGSPYATTRPSHGVGSPGSASKPKSPESTKPAEPAKPGIHAGMSRQELMAQVDKSPAPKEPTHAERMQNVRNRLMEANKKIQEFGNKPTTSAPKPSGSGAKLKVIKSLEALAPQFHKGMSMSELKKAEDQYNNLKSKVEQLLAKGDAEAIKIALEKIKGFNK